MPTYDYQCRNCRTKDSVYQSISEYVSKPKVPKCQLCVGQPPMERSLSVNPMMSGLANALAGDRHYDGLRATDGTDISSRVKHREYMKRNGLTTADDYKQTWEKSASEREALRTATFSDKELRETITKEVMTAVAKPD